MKVAVEKPEPKEAAVSLELAFDVRTKVAIGCEHLSELLHVLARETGHQTR